MRSGRNLLRATRGRRRRPDSAPSMQPVQESSLLSLSGSGGIENLLLSYVSSGDGGLNAILNLRQVCSTTKNWVAALPPLQAKQIFSKSRASVNLHVPDHSDLETQETTFKNPLDTIRKFLESPPPPYVNSLKLTGGKEFGALELSQEEITLWCHFCGFWCDRLESFEADFVDKFLRQGESMVYRVLWCPAVCFRTRRLHIDELEEQLDPLELPQGIFFVENLSIRKLSLSAAWTAQFFESLAKAPRLKSFKMSIWGMKHIEEIAVFLVLTKNKLNLELTFNFNRDPLFGKRLENSTPKQLPPSFVSAVAASSASIRILELDGKMLENLKEIVGDEAAKKFLKTTESDTTPPDPEALQFSDATEGLRRKSKLLYEHRACFGLEENARLACNMCPITFQLWESSALQFHVDNSHSGELLQLVETQGIPRIFRCAGCPCRDPECRRTFFSVDALLGHIWTHRVSPEL